MTKKWFVYILECADKSLYTGVTVDIDRRIRQHNSGNGAKSIVKSKRPAQLAYLEEKNDQSTALKREKEIKGWRREKKLELIEANIKGLP